MPRILWVKAQPLTAEGYRPFGQVIGVDPVRMKIVNDRFQLNILPRRRGPIRITHLHRHLMSTQALIPLEGKAWLVGVASPAINLQVPEELAQVKVFINEGNFGVNIDLGTWHTLPSPLGMDVSLVNIQGEHAGKDTEECSLAERFDTVIEVIL